MQEPNYLDDHTALLLMSFYFIFIKPCFELKKHYCMRPCWMSIKVIRTAVTSKSGMCNHPVKRNNLKRSMGTESPPSVKDEVLNVLHADSFS